MNVQDAPLSSLWSSLRRLLRILSPERRRQLAFVLLLMLATALLELGTIGSVIPVMQLLVHGGTSPAQLPAFLPHASGGLGAATLLFILFLVAAGLVRLQLLRSTQHLVFGLGHELSTEIDRRILAQPYAYHLVTHSSTLIASLEKVQLLVFNVLMPLLQMVTAVVVTVFIAAALIYVDPFTAGVAIAGFGAIYVAISWLRRRRLARNSEIVGSAYDERIKIIQESLGGIRDIIIDRSAPLFVDEFREVDARLTSALSTSMLIAATPRILIETFGVVLIALLAVFASGRPGGFTAAVPVLGVIALGAQRLLPFAQQIYAGWATVAGNMTIVGQVVDLASLPVPHADEAAEEPLPFRDNIALECVSFTYAAPPTEAIKGVTIQVPRGAVVGLAGRSGSGKSTLADLLMGLLVPSAGRIRIDDVALDEQTRPRWWRSIAHVPQDVFLTHDTIARNIAFGVDGQSIDMLRVVDAAARAQLHDMINALPEGYNSLVGERGVSLSGGQRQRIALARAIYKRAPLIILDEPTSSLDAETERAVLDTIDWLRREGHTIVIIAHGPAVLGHCDLIVRLEHGRVAEVEERARAVPT